MARAVWLPHPGISIGLLVMWLILNSTIAPGHVLLGAFLGWIIPLITRQLWDRQMTLRRPKTALRLILVVLYDIVVANIAVARLVVGPKSALRPGFIQFPLQLQEPYAIWTLASIITLTPGTVSSELSEDRKFLLIHVLDFDNPEDVIGQIRDRYEAPLKEIFI